MDWRIPFFRHDLGKAELDEVQRALAGLVLSTGDMVQRFESRFAEYLGIGHCVATSSGTLSLQLALRGLGIGPGDEVITSAATFAATALAIRAVGARPVLVDVDPLTANIDPTAIAAAITPRTKAILPVHLYGLMADMRAIRAVADRHGLAVIEDCAHCIEGVRDGARPGALSDAACFSFYGTKNITSGEGGAVVTADARLAARLRPLSLHGVVREPAHADPRLYRHWDIAEPGMKCNMSNLAAAILLPQMERIDANLTRREQLAARYAERLAPLERRGLLARPADGTDRHARHLYTIWVAPERRDQVVRTLNGQGIGAVINYRCLARLTMMQELYGLRPEDFPVADRIGESTISLPFYPKLSEAEVDLVADSLGAILDAA